MSESLQPLGARVLVRVLEEESVTASGLVIPDTAKEKPRRGEVVAVGDDAGPAAVAVGERVLFPTYSGTEVALDGTRHLILDAADVLAVFRATPGGGYPTL